MHLPYHAGGRAMRWAGLKHDSNLVRGVGAEWLLPQCNRVVDALFAFFLKTPLRLSHRRRKNDQQHIAVVRLAQSVLQCAQAFRGRFERRIEIGETLERVPEPFTSDAKIVKPLLVATLETGRERFDLTPASVHHALHDIVEFAYAAKVDAFRLHSCGFTVVRKGSSCAAAACGPGE